MGNTPLPIRVLVKGASTVVYTSWMGGPRSDFAYPRAIEERLRSLGYDAEVRVSAVPAERTRAALRTWHTEILPWSPDVVILHYGHMECIHLFLPRLLERHVHSLKTRPGRVREAYRKVLVRPIWKVLAQSQAKLDRIVDPRLLAYRNRRCAADLERLIGRIRSIQSPLVLVPTLVKPGPNYREWFPGIEARMAAMNVVLGEMIDSLDSPDVRSFPVGPAIVGVVGTDGEPTPDGGHFSPEAHRAVGAAIGDAIAGWAAGQAHLALT